MVYASWEDEDDEQLRRLSLISGPAAPWCTPTRCQTLHALDLVGEGPTWGMPAGRLASSTPHLLPTGQRVRSFAEDIGARLLILDAAAAAFSGNENDRALVRAFLASWDSWARLNNCTVLLLAHPPKSGDPFSGSTDWLNACRAGITLSRDKIGAKPKGKQEGPPPVRVEAGVGQAELRRQGETLRSVVGVRGRSPLARREPLGRNGSGNGSGNANGREGPWLLLTTKGG